MIMPQVLINIALNVFPCNAPREIPPCMAYPSLAVLCTYCQATSIHCLQEGHLLIWPVIIHLPPPSREELIDWVQKSRVCREELHHNTRLCCKPFIHKARVVESHIVPNYDIQTHARPQQPSLFGWNQYFFQCIKKCDEAFCIVWANSWYVDPIIGDGSTHGDIGTPLTWHCDSGPLPNDVPPASPHFTEVEAGFIHKNQFVMCPFSFKLHYSLRNSKFLKQIIPVACNYGEQGITIKNLYLHILESCLLYDVRVSLKWNSVQLLHSDMVSFKDSIYSCQTHTVYISKCSLICNP